MIKSLRIIMECSVYLKNEETADQNEAKAV